MATMARGGRVTQALVCTIALTALAASASAQQADLEDQFKSACKVGKARFGNAGVLNDIATSVCFENSSYSLYPGVRLTDLAVVILAFIEETPPGWHEVSHTSCVRTEPVCEAYGPRPCTQHGAAPCTSSKRVCTRRNVKGDCTHHQDVCTAWGDPPCTAWGDAPCTQWGSQCAQTASLVDEGAIFATIGAGADLFVDGAPPPVPSCLVKKAGQFAYGYVNYTLEGSSADVFRSAVNTIAAANAQQHLEFSEMMNRLLAAFAGITVTVSSSSEPSEDLAMAWAQWAGEEIVEIIKDMTDEYEQELDEAAAAG